MPGHLKTAVDWASRPFGQGSPLWGKPVAVIGASVTDYGAVWAQDHLRKSLGLAGARVARPRAGRPEGGGSLRNGYGELADPETRESLVEPHERPRRSVQPIRRRGGVGLACRPRHAPVQRGAAQSIAAATPLGPCHLTVNDLDRSRAFYERAIGMRVSELDDGALALGVAGERPLIELRGDSSAPRLNRRAPGLYHLAILVPTRLDLAFALARLAEARWPLDGASDHLVSEALYLSDPDGNGIEIYRDRPRADWPRSGDQLQMSTLPLDLDGLIGELTAADELQADRPFRAPRSATFTCRCPTWPKPRRSTTACSDST